jgi:subtilisin family serine protease
MSTPLVAGAAALYLQRFPSATPDEVVAGIVAESTPDKLKSLPADTPNRLLYVKPEEGGTEPSAGPKVVDGRWEPFLRGAINCCNYDGTPDVNEGLTDG